MKDAHNPFDTNRRVSLKTRPGYRSDETGTQQPHFDKPTRVNQRAGLRKHQRVPIVFVALCACTTRPKGHNISVGEKKKGYDIGVWENEIKGKVRETEYRRHEVHGDDVLALSLRQNYISERKHVDDALDSGGDEGLVVVL
jgi:hypothetical protein